MPVIIARIGGTVLAADPYAQSAERSRSKSSSGVQDVLLTRSFVFPAMIFAACCFVSGSRLRQAILDSELEIGWKIVAGRS